MGEFPLWDASLARLAAKIREIDAMTDSERIVGLLVWPCFYFLAVEVLSDYDAFRFHFIFVFVLRRDLTRADQRNRRFFFKSSVNVSKTRRAMTTWTRKIEDSSFNFCFVLVKSRNNLYFFIKR